MPVAFNRVNGATRVPFWYAEVNSGVSYFAGNSKHLVIGQKLVGGTAAANVPRIVRANDSSAQFGAGSMLAQMVRTAKKNNPQGEIWALPLADPTGTAATATLALAGTLTPGILVAYVEGERVAITVTPSDTPATLATALAAAINAGFVDLQGQGNNFASTAAVSGGTSVVLTANHKGTQGNFLSVDKDLVGDEGPNAALITITAFAGGTGVPDITAGLAACGQTEFDMISMAYADTTSLNTMQSFLGGRWDPSQQLYGHCFTANFGNLSAQSTLGAGRNDPHMSVMGVQSSPTPPWVWAAAIGGQVQLHKNLGFSLKQAGEISRPMHTLALLGVKPPKNASLQWDSDDRNTLYYDGISGFFVARDGTVCIDRLISTYQTNAWGSIDTTFLDIEPLYQTAYSLRYFRQRMTAKHARDAIVPDNPGAVQGFTTLADLKADEIHAYADLVGAGVMKNLQLFADSLVLEQGSDPNRINNYLPFDVVNQLRIFAVNATTFLNAAAA
jgi:phage tail sheath gpL-like